MALNLANRTDSRRQKLTPEGNDSHHNETTNLLLRGTNALATQVSHAHVDIAWGTSWDGPAFLCHQ